MQRKGTESEAALPSDRAGPWRWCWWAPRVILRVCSPCALLTLPEGEAGCFEPGLTVFRGKHRVVTRVSEVIQIRV